MCRLVEHRFRGRIFQIDLRTLQYLRRERTVGIIHQERSSAGFSHILHHTAYTQRTTQFFQQIHNQLGIFHFLYIGVAGKELLLQEKYDFPYIVHRVFSAFKHGNISIDLFFKRNKYSAYDFFETHGIGFYAIGYDIIDIFNKNHIGIYVIEVLDKGAMSSGTEKQLTFVSERLILHIGRNGIGRRFLFRKTDVIFHIVLFFIQGLFIGHDFFEIGQMLMGYGKMHIHVAGLVASIHGSLGQMFFHGRTIGIGIMMEFEHTFR